MGGRNARATLYCSLGMCHLQNILRAVLVLAASLGWGGDIRYIAAMIAVSLRKQHRCYN